MPRSFGPNVHHNDDGSLRATCNWCVFRINVTCTHRKPTRMIPDPSNTPDWCEMKAEMMSDVKAAIAKATDRA